MEVEKLTFSVLGFTVRGFFEHKDDWVPVPGQRLPCSLSRAIHVLKEGESVGSVAAEAPDDLKDWLRNGGQMEAVVTDLPKLHRKKGDEVPVIFVLTGTKNFLMTNIKRAIEKDVLKKQKSKKSLDTRDGDITQDMVFPKGFGDENQLDFSVVGMVVRGFHVYRKNWVPEQGERFPCSKSKEGSVELSSDGITIGNIPTEKQNLFKTFLNANGNLTAVVAGDPKTHRYRGGEVPVTYVFTSSNWTNKLKNSRNSIIKDVEKTGKKRKSVKVIAGDVTQKQEEGGSTSQSDGVAGTSGGDTTRSTVLKEQKEDANEKQSEDTARGSGESVCKATAPSGKVQSPVVTDGSGEMATDKKAPNSQIKNTRKRSSDRAEESVPKKVTSGEQIQRTEDNHTSSELLQTEISDDEEDMIVLSENQLSRIAQQIGKTWIILGIQLGFKNVETQHIERDHRESVLMQIYTMLIEWKRRSMDKATLYYLRKAMKHCPKDLFQQPELDELFISIKEEYWKEG